MNCDSNRRYRSWRALVLFVINVVVGVMLCDFAKSLCPTQFCLCWLHTNALVVLFFDYQCFQPTLLASVRSLKFFGRWCQFVNIGIDGQIDDPARKRAGLSERWLCICTAAKCLRNSTISFFLDDFVLIDVIKF